jgi:8-oxo-dGTP diphosphatase
VIGRDPGRESRFAEGRKDLEVENRELRRRTKQREQENGILRRPTAYFARDVLSKRCRWSVARHEVLDAGVTAEPLFVARPGQVDYTHIRYAPVVNAAVVCLGKVLLLQRSSSMRSYPNRWCGISGYLDDDRSVEDKARQEMLEEVGITADRIVSMQRGTVLLQEAPHDGKSWLVVPVLVRVRDRHYRLDWESQAAGWFSMNQAMTLPLLPGVDAVIAQYRDVIDSR